MLGAVTLPLLPLLLLSLSLRPQGTLGDIKRFCPPAPCSPSASWPGPANQCRLALNAGVLWLLLWLYCVALAVAVAPWPWPR